MALDFYTANFNASVTNTKTTLLQLTTSASVPIVITRAAITSSLTAATAQRIQIVRYGTAAASMTAGTAQKLDPGSPNAATSVGVWVSTQTDGATPTVLYERTVDLRAGAGWDWLPVPEARLQTAVSSNIALALGAVLAGTTALSVELEWYELG